MEQRKDLARVENPMGNQLASRPESAAASSDAERAIQEVQASMVIAKRFPRDQVAAVDRIVNSCTRPSLAEGALYSYPKGGTDVTGPTIRLAEAIAQQWGNIQFGVRELSSDNGVSTVEAFAWDLETNTKQVKTFQVAHIRYSSTYGAKKLVDPRDIYETIANQGARRLRACILGVVPGDVTETAVKQCELTQSGSVNVTPELIKSMVDLFKKNYGVEKEHIQVRIGKHVEGINAPQMINLKKIYQSLKDGMSKPSDWFDVPEGLAIAAGPQKSDLAINTSETKKTAPEATDTKESEPEPQSGRNEESNASENSANDTDKEDPRLESGENADGCFGEQS